MNHLITYPIKLCNSGHMYQRYRPIAWLSDESIFIRTLQKSEYMNVKVRSLENVFSTSAKYRSMRTFQQTMFYLNN